MAAPTSHVCDGVDDGYRNQSGRDEDDDEDDDNDNNNNNTHKFSCNTNKEAHDDHAPVVDHGHHHHREAQSSSSGNSNRSNDGDDDDDDDDGPVAARPSMDLALKTMMQAASSTGDKGGDGDHKGKDDELRRLASRSTNNDFDEGSFSSASYQESRVEDAGIRPGSGFGSGVGDGDGDGGESGTRRRGAAGSSAPPPEPTARPRVYRRRWFGLVQLVLLNIMISWGWLTFAPVASMSAQYYGVSESAVNWLATGFLFAFVAATPATIWALHLGPRPAIAASAALVLVGNWVRYAGSYGAYSDGGDGGDKGTGGGGGNFGVVVFGQILIGLAQPFVLSAPTRYSDMWFTSRGRVAATALASLANPFGAALGQLVVPFMVVRPADVSAMVLYVAIISTVIALPSFFVPSRPPSPPELYLLPSDPATQQTQPPSNSSPRRWWSPSPSTLHHLGRREPWLVILPFAAYVGLFNAASSLLAQLMGPHGYSADASGIGGALLIVVGLVAAAVSSPLVDRARSRSRPVFLPFIRAVVPAIAASYLALALAVPWSRGAGGWGAIVVVGGGVESPDVAGPYVVLAALGASSFALVPVALEFLAELTHPLGPEVTATLAWSGGQLTGAVFILAMDALRTGDGGGDAGGSGGNMDGALALAAAIAWAALPLPLLLGLFGRADKVALRRVADDGAEAPGWAEPGAVGQDQDEPSWWKTVWRRRLQLR